MNTSKLQNEFVNFLREAERELEADLKAERAKAYKADQQIERLKKELDQERLTIRDWKDKLDKARKQNASLMLQLSDQGRTVGGLKAKLDETYIKLNRLEDMERLGQLQGGEK